MSIGQARLALSLAGMVVAVLAIMLEDRRLVWGAIALLAVSLALKLAGRRRPPPAGGEGEL